MPNEHQSKEAPSRANPKIDTELNIESIISAPLVAASKANVMMLTGQTRFLLNYCFDKEGKVYKPEMVTMTLSRSTIESDNKLHISEMAFQMPLLCLLPLNSLGIDNIHVDFDLEITSFGSYSPKTKGISEIMHRKAVLNGRVASQHRTLGTDADNKDRISSNLKVSINAGSLPLPPGIISIIDLYTKAIQPIAYTPAKTSDKPTDNSKSDQQK